MDMDRILAWVLSLLVVFCIVVVAVAFVLPGLGRGGGPVAVSTAEAGCLASGGTVGAGTCCLSSDDFPGSCAIGACGCSAENSHAVKTCTCPAGKCFNGTACVMQIGNFGECVAAGYPVMESYPRQCRVPGGPTFVEEIPPALTMESCQAARGHWTECGSRCRLDNTGKPDVICPALCEALCECGGIAGFGCPAGYSCRLVADIADALGYCVAGSV
ncbi:MAG TPA: hypothetical protein VMT31_00250 [Methanomicrobiales archaeon]|nr:hypothetical protein [Methanomicrobiales archaeon]